MWDATGRTDGSESRSRRTGRWCAERSRRARGRISIGRFVRQDRRESLVRLPNARTEGQKRSDDLELRDSRQPLLHEVTSIKSFLADLLSD
jgi:hypothetical protein